LPQPDTAKSANTVGTAINARIPFLPMCIDFRADMNHEKGPIRLGAFSSPTKPPPGEPRVKRFLRQLPEADITVRTPRQTSETEAPTSTDGEAGDRRLTAESSLESAPERRPASIDGLFMTTKPDRSKCSTKRLATIADMNSSALWTPLATLKTLREGERVGEVFGRGRC
jgi:hypothetical protein